MKRRLLIIVPVTLAILVSFCVGALAGSRWGDYKGYSVVRVLINGAEARGDVPAINIDGRTMVPARLVAEALGAQADWDQENYTTIISDPETAALSWPDQVSGFLDVLAADFTGWDHAVRHGLLQPVDSEVTVNGCTWHIYAVLADSTQTNVIFGVSGGGATFPRVNGPNCCTFNGQRLPANGGSGRQIDGMALGIMTLDPIPSQVGTVTLTAEAMMTSGGEVDGSWTVSFPVSRTKCDAGTREYLIDKQLSLGDGTVMVKRLVMTPVHTMLTAEWSAGPDVADGRHVPQLQLVVPHGKADAGWGSRLLGSNGAPVAQCIGGRRIQSHTGDDGQTSAMYTMFYDRVDSTAEPVTLHIGAAVYARTETRVPTAIGTVVSVPNGDTIDVTAVSGTPEAGSISLDYNPDPSFPPAYSDWLVLDDAGGRTAMQLDMSASSFTLTWQLPAGRKAVAIILPGYWKVEDAGNIRIGAE